MGRRKSAKSLDSQEICIATSGKPGQFELKGKLWIESDKGTFLGYGRVTLLERVKEYGSISKAAKSMNMSYRQAWGIINSMNKQAGKPLVETKIGGRKGGGSRLTETGEKVVKQFCRIHKSFTSFLQEEINKFEV
ncbi:MAG TPA: winged helix-turn-helix domain-containing protein [Candidatus Hydrothermia bacterium]|nr:winged helix-turn-helix domain-containing protein [Candidatus Hydrothermae bacterium]MDD3648501.1 winged helix-turn-helix domain-containing protein [Candidatus Hydrothermia bacterium]MDD5572500.1 winged helix-turn-helix domain-containing protein [Candidatus Hydrothermia bacterium]HOK23665.1 winged helix-turn-helix domain-containing protein [Candidatus Hydrothermia bacterium]HOL24306.1 winged helix-turn-helix domain-containing protein [Candidatus Hydrothermia bacterium]